MATVGAALLLVIVPLLSPLGDTPAVGSQDAKSITCVPRTAEIAPPPMAKLPELRAKKGIDQIRYRPLGRKPVCPEGKVPAVEEISPEVRKGNPLLKPEADDRTVGTESHLPCNGILNFGVCYYYANATYRQRADGGGMIMTIAPPGYVASGGPGHSVNEIAVQGGERDGNIVELD